MIRRLTAIWLVLSAFRIAAFSQLPERSLQPGSTIAETLGGAAEPIYNVTLPPDQGLPVQIVEQQGMAGIVVILAPNGRELAQADLSRRSTPAAKSLLIPPNAARMVVRPANHSRVQRIFEIRSGEYGPLNEQEPLRIEADRLLGQGARGSGSRSARVPRSRGGHPPGQPALCSAHRTTNAHGSRNASGAAGFRNGAG